MSDTPSSRREYPERPHLAASVAVYRDGKFLVAARGNPPFAQIYSLPGGMVETGETVAEAALRELAEEVAVTAHEPVFIGPVETICLDDDGRVRHHHVIMVHAALWKSGEGETGPEASAILWLTPEQVDKVETTPQLKEMLMRAREALERQTP